MNRWLVGFGSVLLGALAGYGLWHAARSAGGDRPGTVLGLVAVVGLIAVLASNSVPRHLGSLRRGLTVAGALMLGSFAAYVLWTSARGTEHGVSAGAVFTMIGMAGLLLLLAGTTLQRVRP